MHQLEHDAVREPLPTAHADHAVAAGGRAALPKETPAIAVPGARKQAVDGYGQGWSRHTSTVSLSLVVLG